MERAAVHGLAVVRTETLVALTGVPVIERVLRVVAELGLRPGYLIRTPGGANLSLTVPRGQAHRVAAALGGTVDRDVAEVVLTGAGLRSDVAIVATFCEALAGAGVPLTAVAVQTTRLAVLCAEHQVGTAVRALGEVFEIVPGQHPGPVYSAGRTATNRSSAL